MSGSVWVTPPLSRRVVDQFVLLFGLALVVAGVGVLIALRDVLGIRWPARLGARDRETRSPVRAPGGARAARPAEPVSPPPGPARVSARAQVPRAVGRAAVPGVTAVQPAVRASINAPTAVQAVVEDRVRRRLRADRERRRDWPPAGRWEPPSAPLRAREVGPESRDRPAGRRAPPPERRELPAAPRGAQLESRVWASERRELPAAPESRAGRLSGQPALPPGGPPPGERSSPPDRQESPPRRLDETVRHRRVSLPRAVGRAAPPRGSVVPPGY